MMTCGYLLPLNVKNCQRDLSTLLPQLKTRLQKTLKQLETEQLNFATPRRMLFPYRYPRRRSSRTNHYGSTSKGCIQRWRTNQSRHWFAKSRGKTVEDLVRLRTKRTGYRLQIQMVVQNSNRLKKSFQGVSEWISSANSLGGWFIGLDHYIILLLLQR